jgi:hypothetical protein
MRFLANARNDRILCGIRGSSDDLFNESPLLPLHITIINVVIPRVYSKYFLHSCRYDNIHSMTVLRIVHRCLFPSMVPEDLASRHGTSFKKECPISSISFPIGLPGVFFLLN